MFNIVYSCMFTYIYWCLLLFTYVYPNLLVFIYVQVRKQYKPSSTTVSRSFQYSVHSCLNCFSETFSQQAELQGK